MTYGNEQADKLVSFATLEEQHALLHNNAGSLHQLWKIPYLQAKKKKKLLVIALLTDPSTSLTHRTRYQSSRFTT